MEASSIPATLRSSVQARSPRAGYTPEICSSTAAFGRLFAVEGSSAAQRGSFQGVNAMAIPFVGKSFSTVPEFLAYLDGIRFGAWRPRFVTMHHTGGPNLKTWQGWQTRA